MQIQKRHIIQIIIIFVCLVSMMGFLKVAQDARYSATPYDTSLEESPRELDADEGNAVFMTITNGKILKEELPTLAVPITNQLYKLHYQKTQLLERQATIDGEITSEGKTYRFHLLFQPSNKKFEAKITVKNLATRDYDISLEEIR